MSASGDYRKVTMMMENPSYDGFSDGRSPSPPHHKMKPFVLVTLLLLAVVGMAVALAVVLTSGNKTSIEAPEEMTILGNLHISNRQYRTSYADRTTSDFAGFEKEIVDVMDRVYNKSVFRNIYVGASVSNIKEGSVIVEFQIHLEIPKNLFDMRTGTGKKVTASEYNRAYVHLVKAIDGDKLGDFTIIEFSLSFASESLSFEPLTLPPPSSASLLPAPAIMPTDACETNPCTHDGTCVPQPEAAPYFTCVCPAGRSGYLCQNLLASLCEAQPCENNGTCEGDPYYYRCICTEGFKGDNCETTTVSLCDTSPCQHGGTCRGDTYFFNCACTAGWGGRYCENATPSGNPCDSHPCLHGGQCWSGTLLDGTQTYTCICPPNYHGLNCESPIPPRGQSEGGTTGASTGRGASECIDIPIPQCCPFLPYNQTVSPNPFPLFEDTQELHEFFELSYHFLTPSCHPDAQRVLCTLLNPMCPSETAHNPGLGELTETQAAVQNPHSSARQPQASVLDFQLPCLSVCREVHDSCLANLPTQLRREFEVFGNFCYSLPESGDESVCFRSTRPGTFYDEPVGCKSSPCVNGGVCLELNGVVKCRCPLGYGGQTCAYELPSPCTPNPCVNGGVCTVNHDSIVPRFTCNCPTPYRPPFCES